MRSRRLQTSAFGQRALASTVPNLILNYLSVLSALSNVTRAYWRRVGSASVEALARKWL